MTVVRTGPHVTSTGDIIGKSNDKANKASDSRRAKKSDQFQPFRTFLVFSVPRPKSNRRKIKMIVQEDSGPSVESFFDKIHTISVSYYENSTSNQSHG